MTDQGTPTRALTGNASLGSRGLVLSGGGIRFAIHVGVVAEMATWRTPGGLLWLDEFDVLVGTSAGALYAGLYAVGYSPQHIEVIATLLGDPRLRRKLFDLNVSGAAAALLRHDFRYLLGAVRGERIQSMLEFLLDRDVRDRLVRAGPPMSPSARSDMVGELAESSVPRASRKRWVNQLRFDETRQRLFLLGTNALTGQKTVFCKIGSLDDALALDARMAVDLLRDSRYLSDSRETAQLLQRRSQQLDLRWPLEARRFDARIYHQFDPVTYGGRELPISLAIRASLSIPVTFEPVRIAREGRGGEFDIFVDGGVDDNFSLSVALDKNLGKCRKVFGVELSNLGYRQIDPDSVATPLTLVTKVTGYMGDALQDVDQKTTAVAGSSITVLNALTASAVRITDTNQIGNLVSEGHRLARRFWHQIHQPRHYRPVPIAADDLIWAQALGERVYLSPAALGISANGIARARSAPSQHRRAVDLWGGAPRAVRGPAIGGWSLVYVVLVLGLVGMVALLVALVEIAIGPVTIGPVGAPTLFWYGMVAVLAIIAVRIWAFLAARPALAAFAQPGAPAARDGWWARPVTWAVSFAVLLIVSGLTVFGLSRAFETPDLFTVPAALLAGFVLIVNRSSSRQGAPIAAVGWIAVGLGTALLYRWSGNSSVAFTTSLFAAGSMAFFFVVSSRSARLPAVTLAVAGYLVGQIIVFSVAFCAGSNPGPLSFGIIQSDGATSTWASASVCGSDALYLAIGNVLPVGARVIGPLNAAARLASTLESLAVLLVALWILVTLASPRRPSRTR